MATTNNYQWNIPPLRASERIRTDLEQAQYALRSHPFLIECRTQLCPPFFIAMRDAPKNTFDGMDGCIIKASKKEGSPAPQVMTGVEMQHFRGDDSFHNNSYADDDTPDMMSRPYDIMGNIYNTHTAPWTVIAKIGLQTGLDSGIFWMCFPDQNFLEEIAVYRRGDENLYRDEPDMPHYFR